MIHYDINVNYVECQMSKSSWTKFYAKTMNVGQNPVFIFHYEDNGGLIHINCVHLNRKGDNVNSDLNF